MYCDTLGMDILRVYQQGLGATPAAISLFPIELGPAEVESIVSARNEEADCLSKPVGVNEAWPLVSHHHFNAYALFGRGREVIDERTLSYILSFSGVVAADPLAQVSDLFESGDTRHAVEALQAVTRQLAQVEPLLESERLRITAARPSFEEATRKEVLGAFGIDSNFRVFTNFTEAYEMTRGTPFANSPLYIGQAKELFALMGFPRADFASGEEAFTAVQRLGQSLIHLSWQLSVATADPNLDVSPLGELEQRMFGSLVSEAISPAITKQSGVRRTRNFALIGSAGIPNLDRADLTIPDVLAIRGDDAFEEFRLALQSALDSYVGKTPQDDEDLRRGAFEDAMHEASFRLRERSKSSSFGSRFLGAAAQTGVQIAAAFLPNEWNAARVSAEVIASPLTGLILEWLSARRGKSSFDIAHRYCIKLARTDELRS